jgi:hypothetical protein
VESPEQISQLHFNNYVPPVANSEFFFMRKQVTNKYYMIF